jgi:tripartite-type tricarboxylate transporter receptor subunit TctC
MSAAHAATVVLREKAGVRLKVVPFEGGSQARNAVAGGHVDCCMAPYWSAINVLELTRALAIFAPEDPTEGLWDAPPAAEVLPFEMPHLYEPYGAMTSARTKAEHPDRFERLRSTFAEAMTTATFRDAAAEQNLAPFAKLWSAEECPQFMTDYLAMLADYKPSMEQDLAEM